MSVVWRKEYKVKTPDHRNSRFLSQRPMMERFTVVAYGMKVTEH